MGGHTGGGMRKLWLNKAITSIGGKNQERGRRKSFNELGRELERKQTIAISALGQRARAGSGFFCERRVFAQGGRLEIWQRFFVAISTNNVGGGHPLPVQLPTTSAARTARSATSPRGRRRTASLAVLTTETQPYRAK